ncbi:LIM domain-containing protein [Streptomyces sp. SGAir0957]
MELDRAARLAQRYVAEDPLNSEVDLVPVDGAVAVVGEVAYFGFQTRGYLESGDPSQMAIGIGPVQVDLTTGMCAMLGSLEAIELNLFDRDEANLLGPGNWRLVPPDTVDAWRAIFDADRAAPDLTAPCPCCGARELHQWYRVDAPLDDVFDGVHATAYGWRTEWCAACHVCHEDGDSFVPDQWRSPYEVPEAHEMKFAPRYVEAARQHHLTAPGQND